MLCLLESARLGDRRRGEHGFYKAITPSPPLALKTNLLETSQKVYTF